MICTLYEEGKKYTKEATSQLDYLSRKCTIFEALPNGMQYTEEYGKVYTT